MYKVFSYQCTRPTCKFYNGIIDRLVHTSAVDMEECSSCNFPLNHILSAPKGYVIGSENPVKQ